MHDINQQGDNPHDVSLDTFCRDAVTRLYKQHPLLSETVLYWLDSDDPIQLARGDGASEWLYVTNCLSLLYYQTLAFNIVIYPDKEGNYHYCEYSLAPDAAVDSVQLQTLQAHYKGREAITRSMIVHCLLLALNSLIVVSEKQSRFMPYSSMLTATCGRYQQTNALLYSPENCMSVAIEFIARTNQHMHTVSATNINKTDLTASASPEVSSSSNAVPINTVVSDSPKLIQSPIPEKKAMPIKPTIRLSNAILVKRHAQLQVILNTLSIKTRIPEDDKPSVQEGPAFICYRFVLEKIQQVKRINEQRDALKLALKLPKLAMPRIEINEGTVNIEVPKSAEERYFVDAHRLWERYKKTNPVHLIVPFAEDPVGNPVTINFSDSATPHLLIGGTTGSGKSEVLNTLLRGAVHFHSPSTLKLLLIDPKGTEMLAFEQSPYVLGKIGLDAKDTITLLTGQVTEMERRYSIMKAEGCRDVERYNQHSGVEPLPWHLLVIDEYQDLTSDDKERKQLEPQLKRLAQKGRAAGIHVILATQKPSSEIINTTVRSNFPAQLALAVKNASDSRVIMDEMGAETLCGKGDAFFKANNQLVRVQCARV